MAIASPVSSITWLIAVIPQRDGNDVVEAHFRTFRRLDRAGQYHIRVNEDAVHASPHAS